MSMHEDRVSLGDMLRHGREAVALLGGAPLIALLEQILGEA